VTPQFQEMLDDVQRVRLMLDTAGLPSVCWWPHRPKDDLIVHTAFALRRESPVDVFDPTGFSECGPTPWAGITSPGARVPRVAIYPARALNDASGRSGASSTPIYFQSFNKAIHHCCLHAAAVSGRDIVAVRQWATRPRADRSLGSAVPTVVGVPTTFQLTWLPYGQNHQRAEICL